MNSGVLNELYKKKSEENCDIKLYELISGLKVGWILLCAK